jgi:mRNA interferase MazF
VTRGDVVRLKPDRRARPCVVLHADELAPLSTVIVAPTSTAARAASFRPLVVAGAGPTRVLVEQLRAVDAARLGRVVGHLTLEELRAVERALRLVLDL